MTSTPALFTPLKLRGVTLPNRVVVSPMCMYAAEEGIAQEWHRQHYGTYARGKAGLVIFEATAVEPRGRITPRCLGLWSDAHADALRPIVDFVKSQGSVPGIQLGHAGRKASANEPYNVTFAEGTANGPIPPSEKSGWETVCASAIAPADKWQTPIALDADGLQTVKQSFIDAATRAADVGFRVVEIHMAHGYLFHTFLSSLSNQRTDEYGGSVENRMRFPLEVAAAVREALPSDIALFVRVSVVDGNLNGEDGWTLEDTLRFSSKLEEVGVEAVDCSSGGISGPTAWRITQEGKSALKGTSGSRPPGFQVPYAEAVKKSDGPMLSMAVGVITEPKQAEAIIQEGRADLIAIGREMLFNPFWTLHAATELGFVDEQFSMWPPQYAWAVNRRSKIKKDNEAAAK